MSRAAVVLLALLLARPSAAGDMLTWDSYTLTGSTLMPGHDRKALFGARLDGRFALPGLVSVLARADASTISDGGAVDVSLEDPQSFQTLELFVGITRPILGPAPLDNDSPYEATIGPALLYGWTVPMEGGRPALIERYPRTFAGGLHMRIGQAWILGGVGFHEASGRGVRGIFAFQAPMSGAFVGADAALGRHSLVRFYVLVRVTGGAW